MAKQQKSRQKWTKNKDKKQYKVNKFSGDGAYDEWKVYRTLSKRKIDPVIPPQRNAKIKQRGKYKLPLLPRNEVNRGCRKLGRAE